MKTYIRFGLMALAVEAALSCLVAQSEPLAQQTAGGAEPSKASVGSAKRATPREEVFRKFMPGTKIVLTPRKEKYFLGENILLDYQIAYDGDGSLDLGTSTGLGSTNCSVSAIDEAGNQAPRSTLTFHCTGQSGTYCRHGRPVTYTIPLVHYCRLEVPGHYRIRAAHDLYWSNRDPATGLLPPIPDNDARWAETTIVVVMPSEVQARKVVEQMRQLRSDVDDYRHLGGLWKTSDYADFACFQYPIYLPILEQLASSKDGDKRALMGITHIPTPEATATLFRMLKDADRHLVPRVIASLCDRLPDPPGVMRPGRENPIQFEDADPKLVRQSWRDDFAAPARRLARELLTDEDSTNIRCGAYILEAVGTANDMPALVAVLNKLVPVVEATKPPQYIGEIAPIRVASSELGYAIEALAGRGVEPIADPRTPGDILHVILALKQRKDFRPSGWEKRCLDWIEHSTPYLREAVLFNSPRPIPESLVGAYRSGVQQVIASTKEQTVIHIAVQFALDVKIPVDEILGMLVGRLDSNEPQMYVNLSLCLRDLLESGKHDHPFADCTRVPNAKEIAKMKAAWKQFLKEHGQAIRQGKHFDLHSDKIFELIYP